MPAKKKTSGKTAKKKPARKAKAKAKSRGAGDPMCCECDMGGVISILPVTDCQAFGGVCMGDSFPCIGKKRPAAKKKTKKK
jgi:hypothetical protein